MSQTANLSGRRLHKMRMLEKLLRSTCLPINEPSSNPLTVSFRAFFSEKQNHELWQRKHPGRPGSIIHCVQMGGKQDVVCGGHVASRRHFTYEFYVHMYYVLCAVWCISYTTITMGNMIATTLPVVMAGMTTTNYNKTYNNQLEEVQPCR